MTGIAAAGDDDENVLPKIISALLGRKREDLNVPAEVGEADK
jgi:hypothetical protein